MSRVYSGLRESKHFVVSDITEVSDRDIGIEPAPILEKPQRASAVALARNGDVDLLICLSASP